MYVFSVATGDSEQQVSLSLFLLLFLSHYLSIPARCNTIKCKQDIYHLLDMQQTQVTANNRHGRYS